MNKVLIIVSCYNEENNIINMYSSIKENTNNTAYDFYICFVDDGSKDKTYEMINTLLLKDDRVKVVKFKKNFGHEIAMIAGIDENLDYDYYILMDADTQHPPKHIKEIVNAFNDGHDAVLMRRVKYESRNAIINFLSDLYYDLFYIITREKLEKRVSDYIAFDNNIATIMRKKYRYKNRMLRFIVQKLSKNPTIIEFEAPKRFSGESKYNFFKYLKLAIDSIKAIRLFKNDSDINDLYYDIDLEKTRV